VRHWLPRARQTTKYVRQYYEAQGLYQAKIRPCVGRFRVLGRPAWLWREVVTTQAGYAAARIFQEPDAWAPRLVSAARTLGVFKGIRG
jgi:hypothetical protein